MFKEIRRFFFFHRGRFYFVNTYKQPVSDKYSAHVKRKMGRIQRLNYNAQTYSRHDAFESQGLALINTNRLDENR